MTKSIRTVKQNLENLESQVGQKAIELEELRRSYLELLSQSLKQQLIFACYQICTQFYPQSFINLSLSAKQNLQQKVRQFGSELEPQLIELLEQKELEPEPIELNLMAQLIEKLPKAKRITKAGQGDLSTADLELVKAEIANLENIENLEDIELIAIETSDEVESSSEVELAAEAIPEPRPEVEPEESEEESPPEQIDFSNPQHLILWHQQIERGIKKTLDNTSRQVNKLLQTSAIVPSRLPSKVMDVAMQTDSSKGMKGSSKQPKVPHVMHLSIEGDRSKKSKSRSNSMQVSLLRLRLAEVEFADHLLNAKRGQIRNLMGKIKKLNEQYKEIQQELAVIEAQAAWRSSWYED
ncbi:MAG: hypothetical protein AAFO95_09880 [Cyanobacteria bacterium J06600_6]